MSEWIRVSERLPEEAGTYLMVLRHPSGQEVILYHFGHANSWDGFPVTHWKPIPAPEFPPDDEVPLNELVRNRKETNDQGTSNTCG
jgi:hypothetical protein